MTVPTRKLRVLILAANPADLDRLSLAEEERVIKAAFERGAPKRVRVDIGWDLDAEALARQLTAYRPEVVHFAGHGNERGEPMLIDATTRDARPVAGPDLIMLLRNSGDELKCVVLNACYSTRLAQDLALSLPIVVIGMRHEIADQTALRFADQFYDRVSHGSNVAAAFDSAAAALRGAGLPGGNLPQRNSHPDVDPDDVVLLPDEGAPETAKRDPVKPGSTPPEALKSLVNMLLAMFSQDEFARFLRFNSDTGDLLNALPHGGAPATFFASAVDALEARGLIGEALFVRIIAERPRREAEIRAVQAKFPKAP